MRRKLHPLWGGDPGVLEYAEKMIGKRENSRLIFLKLPGYKEQCGLHQDPCYLRVVLEGRYAQISRVLMESALRLEITSNADSIKTLVI